MTLSIPILGSRAREPLPGTGIMLNNFCHWFDLDADSPNVIGPRKKNEMCLSPGMIWRDGRLFACIGTPGSYGIMETTPQFMVNVMDHGMTVQAAVAIAGGYADRADERRVQITRRHANGIVEKMDVPPDYLVRPGDTLYVYERWL